jgi:hypothetical protein
MTTLTALQHALCILEELVEGKTPSSALRKRTLVWLPQMQEAEEKAILELET